MAEDTLRVRIAVAVRSDRRWDASGWSGATDEEAALDAMGAVRPDARLVWVEADVPLPAERVVEGRVANG